MNVSWRQRSWKGTERGFLRGILLGSALAVMHQDHAWGAAEEAPKTPETASRSTLEALLKATSYPIDQAVRRALSKTPGQPVKIELQERDKKPVWEVTILKPDGMDHVYVDARDGSYLIPVFPKHGRTGS